MTDSTRRRTAAAAAILVSGVLLWVWAASAPDQEGPRFPQTENEPIPRSDEAGDTTVPVVVCSHPYIPLAVGVARTYSMLLVGGSAPRQGTLTWRVIGVAPDGSGSVWTQRLAYDGYPELDTEFVTRCELGVGAQEPWFAAPISGLELGGDRWLWPVDLAVGLDFGGAAVLHAPGRAGGVTTTRRHHVEALESITVPAGTFETWRVTYSDVPDTDVGVSGATGTLWVARDAGLVRSEHVVSGITQTWELTGAEDP